jgi:hypothetical protein
LNPGDEVIVKDLKVWLWVLDWHDFLQAPTILALDWMAAEHISATVVSATPAIGDIGDAETSRASLDRHRRSTELRFGGRSGTIPSGIV